MAKTTKTPKIVTRSLAASGFYSDFEKSDMLYAALIRSPATAGVIKDIQIPDLPDGYFLYTAKDIPGKRTMELNDTQTKFFEWDAVTYTGEPLAIVIGPDENILSDLVENAEIQFDIQTLESALNNVMKSQKPSSISFSGDDFSIQDNAPLAAEFSDIVSTISDMPSLDSVLDKNMQITEKKSAEVASRQVKFGIYENEDYEEAEKKIFESEKFIINESWSQTLVNPKWHETSGAFCYTEGEKLHVYAPTKWTYFLQKTISEALNIDKELIFIHKTKSSGIYSDGLWRTTQLAVQTALAAWLSKKPVKLVLSQKEQKRFMTPGVETKITYDAAVSENGRIKALKVNIDIDVGSENPFAQELADRLTIVSCNYYQPENLLIKTVAHTSKNPPTSINIKGLDSQSFFAIENQIQKISNVTGIYPDEIRQINSVLPKDKVFPFEIEKANFDAVIQNTIAKSDFNRKYSSFHMDAIDRVEKNSAPFFALPLRGIGISTAYNVSGYNGKSTFLYYPKIEVTLYPEEKLVIHTIHSSDVNHEIWKNTAAEILQIPKANVSIDSNYTVEQLPQSPEDAYSTIGIVNQLVKRCCSDIQKRRFHDPLPITIKKGVTQSGKTVWDKDNFNGVPFMSTSLVSCVVEIELDPYTFNEKIRGIWLTIDCGEILDMVAALRNVRLEVQQELSMLVRGKTVSCDDVFIDFLPSKNKAGQIGELIHNSLPAAFTSALSIALATQVTEFPCTEDQLFNLIKNRGERGNEK